MGVIAIIAALLIEQWRPSNGSSTAGITPCGT